MSNSDLIDLSKLLKVNTNQRSTNLNVHYNHPSQCDSGSSTDQWEQQRKSEGSLDILFTERVFYSVFISSILLHVSWKLTETHKQSKAESQKLKWDTTTWKEEEVLKTGPDTREQLRGDRMGIKCEFDSGDGKLETSWCPLVVVLLNIHATMKDT